jgi:hypothetical protein
MTPAVSASTAKSLARSVTQDTTDTTYASAISNGLNPNSTPNLPAILVGLMQDYVGSNALALNTTQTFPAINVTTPMTATIGSSKIKVTTSNTDVIIYWVTSFTNTALGPLYVAIKIDLTGFTPGVYTDYTLATAYVEQYSDGTYTTVVNEIEATNNLSTKTYARYSPYIGSSGSGCVLVSTLNSNGTYYGYNLLVGANPTTNATLIRVYGDGTNALIANTYYVDGSGNVVPSYYGSNTAVSALETALTGETLPIANYAPETAWSTQATTWTNVAGTGSNWYSLYGGTVGGTVGGSGGTFTASFGTPSTWFN